MNEKPTYSNTSEREPRTNADLLKAYMTWCRKVRGHSATTLRTYDSRLRHWISWRGRKSLLTAQRQDMEAFLTRERERRGRGGSGAAGTQALEAAILRGFYKWCYQEGLTSRDMSSGLVTGKVRNINPRPISDSAWLALWDRNNGAYERCLLGLSFFCGLRRSELAQLKPDQLTSTSIVNFPRKGGGEDTVPWRSIMKIYEEKLPNLVVNEDWMADSIDAYTSFRRTAPRLFPWENKPDWMNRELARLCTRAEIHRVTPHQMRHSAATNLLRAGVPIMLVRSILNHSSVDITMRYVQAGGSELDMWLEGRWGQ